MKKEESRFSESVVFEGMTSIRAVIKGYTSGVSDRRIIKIFVDKNRSASREKIRGSVLFISGKQDGMCPASESSKYMMERLKAHGSLYPREHLDFEHLGHFILPFKPYATKLLIAERKYPKECDAERVQAWNGTLDFLRERW